MLMQSVLKKVNCAGHSSFNIGMHTIHAVICTVFRHNNQNDPKYQCLNKHTQDFNLFMDVKCRQNSELQSELLAHILNNNRWKQIALKSLQLCSSLNLKQSVQQYIQSNSSLRRWCNGKLFVVTSTEVTTLSWQIGHAHILDLCHYRLGVINLSRSEKKFLEWHLNLKFVS